MKRTCIAVLTLLLCCTVLDAKPVALFYLTDGPDSVRSFLAHQAKIDLLPTWYSVDENGLVTGASNLTVLEAAQRDRLPVMTILALLERFRPISLHRDRQVGMAGRPRSELGSTYYRPKNR